MCKTVWLWIRAASWCLCDNEWECWANIYVCELGGGGYEAITWIPVTDRQMRCNLPACIWCKSSLGCTAFITLCCLTATPIRGLKGKRQIIQTPAKDMLTFFALDDRSWRCRDDMDVLVAVYMDQHYSLHHSCNEEAEMCLWWLHHCLV